MFEDLVAIRHNNYQITLDGDAEWHDRTRLLANKSGTFDVIWNNLVQMQGLQQDFRITLRLHVHSENIESVRRLYINVQQTFGADDRYQVFFHRVSNLSGEKGIPQTLR
ncbi:hypothetical protein [Stenotrophomonas sp.]|uniref:hypothetical protein n=1 Tax=Stenotrophomonas sp. TaxID=69392 RepID=UPI0028989521|nr:hypothetical protein [Stenotrophomonas sp.]